MARSVAFYLTRFDEDQPKVVEPDFVIPEAPEESIVVPEESPPPDVLSEEVRLQLIEEGRVAAAAEYAEQIEHERAGFAEHLENERRRWASEEGERLGEQFRVALDEFTAHLEDSLGRILEPFVVREVREQMLASLLERLRLLLTDREKPVIHLSGPMDLLEAVCSKLNADDLTTCIDEVGGIDVKVRLDSTSIETRLDEWLAQLRDGE